MGASATVSCAYTDGGPPGPAGNVLSIAASDEEVDAAAISRAGETIGVSDDRTITPVACSGGTPTVTNVDTIAFTGATGTSLAIDERGGAFAPGASEEADGGSEIEFTIDWDDDGFLALNGEPGGNDFSFGATPTGLGLDLNAGLGAPDVDAELGNLSFAVARGGSGSDALSAAGGAGFAGPFAREVEFQGKGGDDSLTGSPLDDGLSGGAGRDRLAGEVGDDELGGGSGKDDLSGGRGRDRIDASDGDRDRVRCGAGKDRVEADRRDRLAGCERVRL